MCVPISTNPSKLVSRGKNNLLSDDLLRRTNETMFDNSFINQHRFDYSESSDNEDDETLDLNIIINIDDDAGDKIIPHVHEFENASGFCYTSSHN